MTPSKITTPLFLGITGTIGFNLSPIVLGYDMRMNEFFMLFAGIMLLLSFKDRRVLGYATVLSACNPANQLANLSFSFLLAVLTIFKEFSTVGQVVRKLGKRLWWLLLLAAFFLIVLSLPAWPTDLRGMMTEVKQVLSRLGYLAAFPVAVGLTIRTRQEGVRVVSLLCLLSVALLAVFYFRGEAGMDVIAAVEGGESIGVEQQIGNIYLNFVRTQVCIPIAALAVSCLALGTCLGFRFRTLPYCLALISCVFMIVQLASIGSALAMVCGFGVIFFIYFRGRMSPSRIMLGVVAFLVVGLALYWGVFHTGSILAARIDVKNDEISATGIDRMPFWIAGITKISETPLGTGWSSVSGHSDWLLFGVAYGLPTGLLYLIAAVSIFLSLLRSRRTAADIQSLTLCLVGLAALSVYTVNSCLDMLSANVGYYQIVWALILTPSAVLAVTGVALGEPRSVANVELQYGNRNEIG